MGNHSWSSGLSSNEYGCHEGCTSMAVCGQVRNATGALMTSVARYVIECDFIKRDDDKAALSEYRCRNFVTWHPGQTSTDMMCPCIMACISWKNAYLYFLQKRDASGV